MSEPAGSLQKTALYDLHVAQGAKMVPFAGYEMPVQYPLGVLKEHLHTREYVGIFDVSHMGQLLIRPRFGGAEVLPIELERLVPADVCSLGVGRQRYTVLTNEKGGILDDLMITNLGSRFLLVVNASMKSQDERHLAANLNESCVIERWDRALIAVQGPLAHDLMSLIFPEAVEMTFMSVKVFDFEGEEVIISRSGYTGEDGFEISIANEAAIRFVELLLNDERSTLVGLGARDSLRLEAGLCLYGSDLDQGTTPVEAGLEWSIQRSRREGGARAGGFPGAQTILRQLGNGPRRRRVGLLSDGRTPIRAGTALYAEADYIGPVGAVTSGGYGPTVGQPVAMGYVDVRLADNDTPLFADVRGRRIPVVVTPPPFVPHRYKR
jgi:aminomethyltransferase